jgi:hypothetical protein
VSKGERRWSRVTADANAQANRAVNPGSFNGVFEGSRFFRIADGSPHFAEVVR